MYHGQTDLSNGQRYSRSGWLDSLPSVKADEVFAALANLEVQGYSGISAVKFASHYTVISSILLVMSR